ncbi:GNAT family N-acetyltransferase [Methanococcoides sp. AM1]|uniref:GNAT family N-acetyltransferase n=1 Tax=Methanococcoides sp. AM1 TaxID=1201011 RepID=UPI001438420F|nr:GNAT family N-acetyltransferase [Methanococcoides sp. AM1]
MKQRGWEIRKAIVDDAQGLKSCMDLAYTKYLDRLKGERLPPMDVDYEEEITHFPVWVAESDNEIVGGLILIFEDYYTTVANVAVRPDLQGTGLGRELMDLAESEAKRKGYLEMRLATHVLLTGNISFYNHLGWSEICRDDTRVYMRKMINV